MNGLTQSQPRKSTPAVNECSHYASQDELVSAIRAASGHACFATERCHECSDSHCQWCQDCQRLSGLFRLQ